MGDENPIRTQGDYSKPSHEGYRNTIELPIGNNMVPLRSDTIRLVQNGCSFHGLWSEDPNQHLKDFLKLVDSLDLDVGSITTREDLTARFLAQFFPPCGIDRDASDKLHNKNADESWEIIENLALYDHEGWDDIKELVKPVKPITTPQGITKTPDRRLLELEESLELGKNGSAFVQGEVPAKMEDPGLFTLPCRLGDSKPFDTLADLGSCVNIIPLYLFKKLNIGLLE
ncbi:hypothetical protein Tco_1201063 [Tanacetum coccineum]